MAIIVRYLSVRPSARNGLPRYFWQPSVKLRADGHRLQRVPIDWANYTDPAALLAAAIAEAQTLNAVLDARSSGGAQSNTAPAAHTLGALIMVYKVSGDYLRLAAKTRRDYLQCLDRLHTWAGDAPVLSITPQRVQKLYDAKGRTAMAAALIRVLRLLLEHGRRANWLRINPAERPRLETSTPRGLIWPRAAVDAFVAAADAMGRSSVGTAVLINEWLGQREADILRLSRAALRGGTLLVRQNKTGAGVALPIYLVAHVVERLRQEEARVSAAAAERIAREKARIAAAVARGEKRVADNTASLAATTLIVSEETGLPYREDNFRHVFAKVRAAVTKAHPEGFAVDHLMPGRDMTDPKAFTIAASALTFMHLRHTAVTRYAEAECDTSLIASISGHSHATVQQIIERYMVRTAKMAVLAVGRRLAAEGLTTMRAETVRGAGA